MKGCLRIFMKVVGWGFGAIVIIAIIGNMIGSNDQQSSHPSVITARIGLRVALDADTLATETAILPEPSDRPLPTDRPIPTVDPTPTWWKSGTLHNATVAEWKDANRQNQIATAADWVASGFDLHTLKDIELYTDELLNCIDTAFDAYEKVYGSNGSMLEIAVTCVGMIGPHDRP